MNIIWHKVWRDLWHARFRTMLVILSTTAGLFVLGFVFGTSSMMRARMGESHRASIPAHLVLFTSPFEPEVVELIRQEPDILDVEGEQTVQFRWKQAGDEEWQEGTLYAKQHFEAQHINLFDLLEGDWPDERSLAAERLTAHHYGIAPGTTILVDAGQGEKKLRVGGIARNPYAVSPRFGSDASFFATAETIQWLTGEGLTFNRLYVRLESFSEAKAKEVGQRLQAQLKQLGYSVARTEIGDPETHRDQEFVDAMLLILTVLGVMSLLLSGFLITNMINATVSQQVWQVGVMRVIGAKRANVAFVYLGMAITYVLAALVLSVVPAAVAAHYLSAFLLNERLNIVPGPFRIIPLAVAIQIVVGLLVPILSALLPTLAATRITPRQAINSYGLGSGFGQNRFEHHLGKIRHLPLPLALSLRNSFRRKKRISLTLITLTLGGVMFITVMSIGASLNNTIDGLVEDFGYDIQVEVAGNHDVSELIEIGRSVRGVSTAEVWGKWPITLHLPDDHSTDREESWGYIWGIPNNTQLYTPNLVSGRPLMPGDEQAILLNNAIAAAEDIRIGDKVSLNIGGKLTDWTVVGLILNINNFGREHIAPFAALASLTGQAGQGSKIALGIEPSDARNAQKIVGDIRTAYETHQVTVLSSAIGEEERKGVKAMFSSIVYLMLVLAVMAGVIGSIGLASTISINVSERRREMAVMRAIGARSTTILGIVIIEGMLVGMLSWFLALPFTFPLAHLSSNAIGDLLFKTQLDYSYSVNGMVAWVAIVLLLSTLASLWPARGAARLSVRQALTYE